MPYCVRAFLLCLLVSLSRAQPASWASDIARSDKLWAQSDAAVGAEQMPIVGNGLLAMQVAGDSLFVAGLFNGKLTGNGFGPCHRAAIPSDVGALASVPAPGAPADAALDVRRAAYFRRSFVDPSPACSAASNASCATTAQAARVWIEQRFFAHRSLPSVFVMEVEALPEDSGAVGVGSTAGGYTGGAPIAYLRLTPTPAYAATDLNLTAAPGSATTVLRTGWTQIQETPATPLQGVAVLSTNATCASTPSGPVADYVFRRNSHLSHRRAHDDRDAGRRARARRGGAGRPCSCGRHDCKRHALCVARCGLGRGLGVGLRDRGPRRRGKDRKRVTVQLVQQRAAGPALRLVPGRPYCWVLQVQ